MAPTICSDKKDATRSIGLDLRRHPRSLQRSNFSTISSSIGKRVALNARPGTSARMRAISTSDSDARSGDESMRLGDDGHRPGQWMFADGCRDISENSVSSSSSSSSASNFLDSSSSSSSDDTDVSAAPPARRTVICRNENWTRLGCSGLSPAFYSDDTLSTLSPWSDSGGSLPSEGSDNDVDYISVGSVPAHWPSPHRHADCTTPTVICLRRDGNNTATTPATSGRTQWRHTAADETKNSEGLLAIALKTITLVKRNQVLQRRLAQLQLETSEFIKCVLANPENSHLREQTRETSMASAPKAETTERNCDESEK